MACPFAACETVRQMATVRGCTALAARIATAHPRLRFLRDLSRLVARHERGGPHPGSRMRSAPRPWAFPDLERPGVESCGKYLETLGYAGARTGDYDIIYH